MPLLSLANELILLVAKELEPPDLNSFLKANHQLNTLLTPLLTRAMLDNKNEVLLWAAETGHEPLARLLLENGADVDYRSPERWTPLQLATVSVNAEFVTFLLAHGAKIDAGYSSASCNLGVDNALHTAARGDCIPMAKLLLDSGANVNSAPQTYCCETALHIAAATGSDKMVELLLSYGADVSIRDYIYYTPLGRAVERKHYYPSDEEKSKAGSIITILRNAGAVFDGPVGVPS